MLQSICLRNECITDCYTQWTVIYGSTWDEDDGKMAEEVTQAYLTWVGSIASKYWSSYGSYFPGKDNILSKTITTYLKYSYSKVRMEITIYQLRHSMLEKSQRLMKKTTIAF